MPLPGEGRVGYIWKMKMVYCKTEDVLLKTKDGLLTTEDNSKWAQVNQTQLSTILWPLDATTGDGGTSELRSTRPNWVLLLATRCLYHGEEVAYIWKLKMVYCKLQTYSWKLKTVYSNLKTIENELRSTGPNLVPLLATGCLYQGNIWVQVNWTQLSTTLSY